MGRDNVLVVRQRDGSVRAPLNTCAHSGNAVCRADEGNAKGFLCTYHGWSYGIDEHGQLWTHHSWAQWMKGLDWAELRVTTTPPDVI